MNVIESSHPGENSSEFPEWERIDTGPLSWLMPELREALEKSVLALRQFAANVDDASALRVARSHLHQAHGALQVVDLEGVSLVTEEIEHLFETFEAEPASCTPDAVETVANAFRAITDYLEELLTGAPHQPVRLFPSYRTLLALRGAERIHPADLFYPDLSVRPPRLGDDPGTVLSPAEIGVQRVRFEKALLQYLRDETNRAATEEMRSAVAAIEASPKQGQQRAFWWVTRAFFDALAGNAVPTDLNVKRLCARINLQIRRLLEGSGTVAERLLRDTLFFVAQSADASSHVTEVKEVYGLTNALPDDFQTERFGHIDFVALRTAKDALSAAKTAWGLVVAGDTNQISGFARDASTLLGAAGSVGRPGLAHVAQVVASIGTELSFDPRKPSDAVGLDVATALLFLEGALDQARSLDETFDTRAEIVVARVEASAIGQPVDEGAMPWLDEISRHAQERLTMASFIAEMQSNLRNIEKVLDAFFREPSQRGELVQAEKQLSQIGGALSVMGHEQAGLAVESGRAAIRRFAEDSYVADTEEFERVAESLGAVGFYIEHIQHRGDAGTVFKFDETTGLFSADLSRAPKAKEAADEDSDPEPDPGSPGGGQPEGSVTRAPRESTVEQEIGRHGDNAASLIRSMTFHPDDQEMRDELEEALHRVQQDAVLVDDAEPKESATAALKALHAATPGDQEHLNETVAALVTQASRVGGQEQPSSTPLPEMSAPMPTSNVAIDAELLEVFLMEADEVLSTAKEALVALKAAPNSREELTIIRRAYHTLKGSGRMVGLMAFGEAGWAVEQTMNHWLAESPSADSHLFDLLEGADAELRAWVDDLTQSGVSTRTPDALIAAAERVRSGGSYAAETEVAPNAPVVDVAVVEAAFEDGLEQDAAGSHELPAPSETGSEGLPGHDAIEAAEPAFAATEVLPGSRGEPVPVAASEEQFLKTQLFAEDEEGEPLAEAPDESFDVLFAVEAPLEPKAPEVVEATHFDGDSEHYEFDIEPLPVPVVARVLPFVLPSGLQSRSDEMKQIGTLTLSVPLYNIYLAEADELLRVLAQDFGEWRHELDRSVSEAAVRAAHSLSGTSSTVGLSSVHDLAYAVESVLITMSRKPVPISAEEIEQLEQGVEGLRAMLHRFAAEILPEPDVSLLATVVALKAELVARYDSLHHTTATSPEASEMFDEFADDGPADSSEMAVETRHDATPIDAAAESVGETEPSFVAEPEAHSEPQMEAEVAPVDGAAPTTTAAPQTFMPDSVLTSRDEIDPELIEIFIEEAHEYLPQIGENLRMWQRDPSNQDIPQALLRAMHTVKGSARMAGAMRLGEIVHNMETRVESGMTLREIPAGSLEELLSAHDRSMELFDALMHPAQPFEAIAPTDSVFADESVEPVVDESSEFVSTESEPVDSQAAGDATTGNAFLAAPITTPATFAARGAGPIGPGTQVVQAVRVRADVLDRLVNQAGEVSISRSRLENEVGQIKSSLSDLTENLSRLRGQLREIEIQAESQMASQLSLAKEQDHFDPLEFDRFTRLQELTRMMAESVNDVATVQQNLVRSLDGANRDLVAQQRMTRDLQQDLMRVRMVPFGSVSDRLYRVVRQTAKEVDKRVNLDVRGGSVEIDRSVLERMVAPFEHLLRNAIVHGVEGRDGRLDSGKNETGELLIEVRQEGNEIVITFSDDGAGLNLDRIREKARNSGILGSEEEISDARASDLIFQHGFSTANEVTELAGRGVGMDVVRAEAGGLGGRVTVDSTRGSGTRFTINLPLTLAVTQVVLVTVAGRTYALPSVLVEQVQQLRPQPLAQAYNDGQVMWLNSPVKLHFLAGLLGERDRSPIAQRYSPLLILRSGGERIAVHVDEVVGNQEVVVKNIGPQLARMSGISGATVLGSGDIVLILNPVQLATQLELERLLVPTAHTAEIGGAVAELIMEPPRDAGRSEPVAGLETLPTIMVVDDSLTVRRVTQRLLTREGYQVVLAKDGVDALQQLQDYTPDVMLVDIEMPRMDGFDLTRNIRGDERYHNIPIIMITSRTADKHRSFAMELGVNVYLGKPYGEDELLGHLSAFLGAKKRATA